jgi:hypothetical protein
MRQHDNNEKRGALATQAYAPDVCAIAGTALVSRLKV